MIVIAVITFSFLNIFRIDFHFPLETKPLTCDELLVFSADWGFLCVFLLQILFMNKIDLFQDKILHSGRHLRLYLPQFKGRTGVSYCVLHIQLPHIDQKYSCSGGETIARHEHNFLHIILYSIATLLHEGKM